MSGRHGMMACKRTTSLEVRQMGELAQRANRPAKGTMICRKLKANPSVLAMCLGADAGDRLVFADPEEHELGVME
ncbi:hypothetical protein RFX30_11610, partial [Acinetobacter baumannii]|nr:hypothetical protein [Acinetobacter baumannii]